MRNIIWEEKKYMNQIETNTKPKNDGKENIITETANDTKKLEWTIIGGKKKWIRTCPSCHKDIIYNSIYGRNRANKKLCKTCCKLGNKNGRFGKGYILSREKHFNFGKHLSKKVRDKIGKSNRGKHIGIKNSMYGKRGDASPNKRKLIGKKNPMYGKIGKLNPNYGNQYSCEQKRKMRLSHIERIKKLKCNGNPLFPEFNINACKFIEEFGKQNGYNFQHALNGSEYFISYLGYWVDGYDKNENVVIEYDERRHYVTDKLKDKDIARMNEIKSHLGCKFLRFNEYTKELKEY